MSKQKRKQIYCFDTHESAISYTKYLETIHWKKIRAEKYLLNPTCEFEGCDSAINLNIHHKTYKRLGNEKLTDLLTLCQHHHCKIHLDLKLKKKIARKTIRNNYLIGSKIYRLTPYRLLKRLEKNKLKGIYEEPIKLLSKENHYQETSLPISLKCKPEMGQLPTIKPHKRSYLVFK